MTAAGPYRLARRLLPSAWSSRLTLITAARAIQIGARLGYAARATVYLTVGGVALLAAFGLTPRAKGAVESLAAWGAWPPGVVLLWITGLGLYAFAGWRALQSVFDADRLGDAPGALAQRIGKGVSGLVYGGLAISVFGVLDAIEDLHEVDERAETQEALRTLLAYPGGGLVVMSMGALVVVAGAANVVRACGSHFTRDLDCSAAPAAWAGWLARIGYAARGLVMTGAGVLTLAAGAQARVGVTQGAGGALEWLRAQPMGPFWLALIGAGLIAFAGYGFCKAWLRRIGN